MESRLQHAAVASLELDILLPKTNPIILRDADLSNTHPTRGTIHVWYWLMYDFVASGLPLDDFKKAHNPYQLPITGNAFFQWLPERLQMMYGSIRNYWYGINPDIRDQHVAAHLYYKQVAPVRKVIDNTLIITDES